MNRNIMASTKQKMERAPLLNLHEYGIKISKGSMHWANFKFKTNAVFHINTMEDYIKHSKLNELPLPPHRKEVHDLIFLSQGTLTRSKGLESYSLTRNQFFFLPAYQITSITNLSPNAKGFYCHFKEEIFSKSIFQKDILSQFPFFQFTSNCVYSISKSSEPFVVNLFQRLLQEYRKGEQCNLDLVATLFINIFQEIDSPQPSLKIRETAALRVANNYKKLIHERGSNKQKVNYYADKLAISPEYLNRCINKIFGRTAHQYLDEAILLEAKVLLKQSTLNISEVGIRVGIENSGDFVRFFRSKTGLTPKQYRLQV
jgi:AraC family transcriptional regulator, transcriptional activator of pobA